MLAATENFPEYHFVVAKAPSIEDEFYGNFMDYAKCKNDF